MTGAHVDETVRPMKRRAMAESRKAADRGLGSAFITNVGLAVLATITGILSARLLHPAGEGELAAIQIWPLLLGTLAMLGLDSALVYFIGREPEKARQFTSTAVVLGLVGALIVGAAAWFVLPYVLSAQRPQVIAAARVFLLIGGIYAVVGIPIGALRGSHSFGAWNLFRILPALAWLCVLALFWLRGNPNAIPLSRWYLIGTFACGLPAIAVACKELRGPLKPDFRDTRRMLRFGFPSAATALPLTLNLQFDQMLIIAFLPARSLGLYVIAVSWSGGVSPLLQAFGNVLFPHVSAESRAGGQAQLLARALQNGAVIALASSMLFMLLAPVGLPFVFGRSFAPSIPSALVLVPAGAILAWARIAEAGLQGLGRPTIVLLAEAAAAVVTIATLLPLLHIFGIFGAAVASLLGYSTIAFVAVSAVSRSTDQKISSLAVPRWHVTRLLVARTVSMIPARHHSPGSHRSSIGSNCAIYRRPAGRHCSQRDKGLAQVRATVGPDEAMPLSPGEEVWQDCQP